MRLSLRDLFGITAICSVIGWSASQVGIDNGLFWTVIAYSTFLSVTFVFMAKDQQWRRFAPLVGAPLLLCCMMPFFSLALVTHGVLLFFAGVYCACHPQALSVRTLCIIVMLCTLATCVAGVVPGIFEARELAALRQEFPVVALDSRLAYERRGSVSSLNMPNLVLSPITASRLNEMESELGPGNYRRYQFERLHDHQYELFVRAIGFGVVRMMRPYPETMRRPPLGDIAFDERSMTDAVSSRVVWSAFVEAERFNDAGHRHNISQADFLDAEGLGALIAPATGVAGFAEHGFHYPPVLGFENPQRWSLERLELVSLLKFDRPRVYVLDHLPRMDQLSSDDVPTRALDAFEAEALAQLWTEKDVVIVGRDNRHRMLGSLRAAKQCVECHTAARGELLGAFSYVLNRVGGGAGG